MWFPRDITTYQNVKEMLFFEICTECRLTAPWCTLSYRVRDQLERLTLEQRTEIVSRTKDGCAPLFLACKNGNVQIMEYLISMCNANIEQKGIYEIPQCRRSLFVTPLWCAAVAGKLDAVKYLVEHGANIHTVSDTGSTPVRSACFVANRGVVEYLVENGADILKPDYNGSTCLMNSVHCLELCNYLLQHGADVNATDVQGRTALHCAIESCRSDTMILLLQFCANPHIKNNNGDDALQAACLRGAAEIVTYLSQHIEYSSQRHAEAQELLGVALLDKRYDVEAALQCWKRALQIRQSDPSNILLKYQSQHTRPAYMHSLEFQTESEIDNMSNDLQAIQIQSLLITERILGPSHQQLIFKLIYHGASYTDIPEYKKCFDIWRYALEISVKKNSLIHSETWFIAHILVHLMLIVQQKYTSEMYQNQLRVEDIKTIIELLLPELNYCMELLKVRPSFKQQEDSFNHMLKVLTHLFYILDVLPKTDAQTADMHRLVHCIVQTNPVNADGDSLLHLAVSKGNMLQPNRFFNETPIPVFPSRNIVELLLRCGANVDAANDSMNTALHIVTLQLNYDPEVVPVLLKHGADVDLRNCSGNRPCNAMKRMGMNFNVLHYITLKCLAARKVSEFKISFRGKIPITLESFVKRH